MKQVIISRVARYALTVCSIEQLYTELKRRQERQEARLRHPSNSFPRVVR